MGMDQWRGEGMVAQVRWLMAGPWTVWVRLWVDGWPSVGLSSWAGEGIMMQAGPLCVSLCVCPSVCPCGPACLPACRSVGLSVDLSAWIFVRKERSGVPWSPHCSAFDWCVVPALAASLQLACGSGVSRVVIRP
jgi:hypothetical protein